MAVIKVDLAHYVESVTEGPVRLWIPWEAFRGPKRRSNGVELWWLDGRLIDERNWPWSK